MSTNASRVRREKLLDEIAAVEDVIKDTTSLAEKNQLLLYLNDLRCDVRSRRYGISYEEHVEKNEVQFKESVPILIEDEEKTVDGGGEENYLIEGDNLISLNLLNRTHRNSFDLIYIDPPYNTGNKDFTYDDEVVDPQDGYFHSKWLSFMAKRLRTAKPLLASSGVLVVSIGYQEVHNLMLLCQEIFFDKQVVCVTIQTSGGKPKGGFSYVQEYLIFVTPSDFQPNPSEVAKRKYSSPYHGMTLATYNQVQRPNQAYPIFVDGEGRVVSCGKSLQERKDLGEYSGDLADFQFDFDDVPDGCSAVWPITKKGENCVWRLISPQLMKNWEKGYIKVVKPGYGQNEYGIQYLSGGPIEKIESGELKTYRISEDPSVPTLETIDYQTAGESIPTIWTNKRFYTTRGSNQIREIFGKKVFSYPKPIELITEILEKVAPSDANVLDFFAGSGTTGEAILRLNKKDGGSRRFILCTNNENNICEEITYQRIKRTIDGYGYKGMATRVAFEKKLTLKKLADAEWIEKVLAEAEEVREQLEEKGESAKVIFEDCRVLVRSDEGSSIDPVPGSLKYFRTRLEPIDREDYYSTAEQLLSYIEPLCNLNSSRYGALSKKTRFVLEDSDLEALCAQPDAISAEVIYIGQDVLCSDRNLNLLRSKGAELLYIPECFYPEVGA